LEDEYFHFSGQGYDDNGHGTHCAGLAIRKLTGVAWVQVQSMIHCMHIAYTATDWESTNIDLQIPALMMFCNTTMISTKYLVCQIGRAISINVCNWGPVY